VNEGIVAGLRMGLVHVVTMMEIGIGTPVGSDLIVGSMSCVIVSNFNQLQSMLLPERER
jgi:hypothetical protein